MTLAEYRDPFHSSNPDRPLTAFDHLYQASRQLEREASESRKDSAKLRRLAQSLEWIACLLSERAA